MIMDLEGYNCVGIGKMDLEGNNCVGIGKMDVGWDKLNHCWMPSGLDPIYRRPLGTRDSLFIDELTREHYLVDAMPKRPLEANMKENSITCDL